MIVFGASGLIGSGFNASWGTYCRHQKPGLIPFDLSCNRLSDLPAEALSSRYALICSAICNIDQVKRKPQESYALNVHATIDLIEQLWQAGIIPAFVSSDAVFDGQKGSYREEDSPSPMIEYGRQKHQVEQFLMSSEQKFLILRTSKVYAEDRPNWLTAWKSSFEQGQEILCATDQVFNPTSLDDFVQMALFLTEIEYCGLIHVACFEVMSKYEFAQKMAQKHGYDSSLIKPVKLNDFDLLEERPLNTSLNCQTLANLLAMHGQGKRRSLNECAETTA